MESALCLSELKALCIKIDRKVREKARDRIHAELAESTSMSQTRVKEHFGTALSLLANEEMLDQDFEVRNSNIIDQLNRMLLAQTTTTKPDEIVLKYYVFLLGRASHRVRSTLVSDAIVFSSRVRLIN